MFTVPTCPSFRPARPRWQKSCTAALCPLCFHAKLPVRPSSLGLKSHVVSSQLFSQPLISSHVILSRFVSSHLCSLLSWSQLFPSLLMSSKLFSSLSAHLTSSLFSSSQLTLRSSQLFLAQNLLQNRIPVPSHKKIHFCSLLESKFKRKKESTNNEN